MHIQPQIGKADYNILNNKKIYFLLICILFENIQDVPLNRDNGEKTKRSHMPSNDKLLMAW